MSSDFFEKFSRRSSVEHYHDDSTGGCSQIRLGLPGRLNYNQQVQEDLKTTKLRLEIAHVLFMDIVGYSKLLIDEQSEALTELNQIVRKTEAAREAGAAGRLIILPTGDGMALVFTGSVEEPVECALEISQTLRAQPSLPVRMGIHSGPVHHQTDVNQRENIAGAGINIAQRVMDCGDAGHILVSKRVADDLAQYRRWQPYLHELGDFEVKHGVVVSVVNLYADVVGNSEAPEKFRSRLKGKAASGSADRGSRIPWAAIVILLLVLIVVAGAVMFFRRPTPQLTSATSPAPPRERTTSAAPEKSIAVLPFENLSEDKANAFFTDGVQDQILTALAKVADLKVISRTSVMQYKTGQPRNLREIAEQLGVTHVLEGSVQRAGNKVRVNAQLINAHTDAHEWADNYDRPVDDVFAIQSEIAKAIAEQLQAKLSPQEKSAMEKAPTKDVAAFDFYSRARNLILTTSFSALQGPNLLQAVDLLNQALARDPSFLVAQCQLAYAHDNLYFLGVDHTAARLAQADAAVAAAFRLRPDAGESHLARAEHLYRGYRDYDGALAELEIARPTLPNDARIFELTGYIARRRGQLEEGLRNLQKAVELDPRNHFTLQQIALSYLTLRRYADEAAVLDRALAIKPDDVDTKATRALIPLDWKAETQPLHQMLAELHVNDPEAMKSVADIWLLLALAERDAGAAQNAAVALGDNVFGNDAVQFHRDFREGLIARMTKDETKARAAFTAARAEQEKRLQTQPDYGPALCVLALVDAGLGRKEDALREGRRAIELMPVEKDSINGAHMVEYFAITAAWLGEMDLACEQLAKALRLQGYGTITYGQLKLTPYWDPLRGYPPFEKIVASLAPK
jgi:TolB-like protein/class 3 adenylate cyclase/Tfp pilus assembly protein PilF